jgi:hypothetical protein
MRMNASKRKRDRVLGVGSHFPQHTIWKEGPRLVPSPRGVAPTKDPKAMPTTAERPTGVYLPSIPSSASGSGQWGSVRR